MGITSRGSADVVGVLLSFVIIGNILLLIFVAAAALAMIFL